MRGTTRHARRALIDVCATLIVSGGGLAIVLAAIALTVLLFNAIGVDGARHPQLFGFSAVGMVVLVTAMLGWLCKRRR